MLHKCKSIGCNRPVEGEIDFCPACTTELNSMVGEVSADDSIAPDTQRDPRTGKPPFLDVFAVHHMFAIRDPSGCIQHASRLLLQSPLNSIKEQMISITEARNTLNRWLELNKAIP